MVLQDISTWYGEPQSEAPAHNDKVWTDKLHECGTGLALDWGSGGGSRQGRLGPGSRHIVQSLQWRGNRSKTIQCRGEAETSIPGTTILMLIRVLLFILLFSTHCRILLVINIDCLAMQTLNFKFITSIFEQFIFEAQSCKVFQKLNIFAVFHMIELSTT